MSTAEIIESALRYNAGYLTPEEEEAVRQGRPAVHVAAGALGTGWKVRLVAAVGVEIPGGFVHTEDEPKVTTWKRLRTTERASDMATRWAKKCYPGLPVKVLGDA